MTRRPARRAAPGGAFASGRARRALEQLVLRAHDEAWNPERDVPWDAPVDPGALDVPDRVRLTSRTRPKSLTLAVPSSSSSTFSGLRSR